MKVCPLTTVSSLAPEIYPYVLLAQDVFYIEKSIAVPPWPTLLHSHSGKQQHPGFSGVYDRSGV